MMINLKNSFRILFILLAALLCKPVTGLAQGFSYIYIQGDKKTPIYTKVEGVMMPRYGKNYALLSRLAPGPLNVEILFQQNEFPALTFTILVPENGKRAFVLNHKGSEFALYDIEQNFYLKPGNFEADDHLPTVLNNTVLQQTTIENTEEAVGVIPVTPVTETPVLDKEIPVIQKEEPKVIVPEITTEVAKDSSKPNFIQDITFNNDASQTTTSSISQKEENAVPAIINSDCTEKISNGNFQKLFNVITSKKTEDEKLGQILDATKRNCFSTIQAKSLVEKLDSDIAKYSALKSIYPKITDQASFGDLESLIETEDWKTSFRKLMQAK